MEDQTAPAHQQVRLSLSREALAYLDALAARSDLRRHQALDRLLREARALEGRVQRLGFEHVGELIGAYRVTTSFEEEKHADQK